MSSHRLPPQPGEWIDRTRSLNFSFEGEALTGWAGDTVSSALLAQDRSVLGRSFKYHRPRSVLSAANHDANVLLQTADRLNVRGDVEPLVAGEAYRAVNTLGGVRRDWGRFIERLAPLLPVGFYYKTFHRPRALFPFWEALIRRLSGLGAVRADFPEDRQGHTHLRCDCLVIGAGAAGLAATRELLAAGLKVVLADENARVGGSVFYAGDSSACAWLDDVTAEIAGHPTLVSYPGTFAAGCYSDLEVALVTPDGLVIVQPRRLLIATGAIEQPAIFRNNDLPGVMLASAAQRLVARYAVAPFTRAVVLAGNPDAYRAALWFAARGVRIEAILDLDADGKSSAGFEDALRAQGVTLVRGLTALEALADGEGCLGGIRFTSMGQAGTLACDGLLMSVGWSPATQLLYQSGGRFAHDPGIEQMVPVHLPPGVHAAGRVNGVHAFEDRVADGRAAAHEILSSLGHNTLDVCPRPSRNGTRRSHPKPWFAHPQKREFVDFDEDIQLADLEVACREGFDNIELLKRFTTNGMGPSQGKHSSLNAARWLADHLGKTLDEVGSTTARPFYHPVPLGVLAGRRVRPEARTAADIEHGAAGAVWMEAGAWRRPRHYGAGDPEACRLEEYRAVRERAGIIDVSTLGKIELVGPDALALLNLAYTGALDSLAVGKTRYVLLCDQRGLLVDDGIAARLGEAHYYVTAGSGHVQSTFRLLTQIAALARLDVEIMDRTRVLSALNVAGPASRRLLQAHTPQALDDRAFPFLGIRETTLFDVPVRLIRVGFVGETGFEIHARYGDGLLLWQRLSAAGAAVGLRPFGIDTQRLLRLEKGHLIVGHDTDGVMHPFETPLGAMVAFSKPRFMGRAALEVLRDSVSRQVVAFTSRDPRARTLEECHLAIRNGEIAGRITSLGFSPTLGCTIGLAVLEQAPEEGGVLHFRNAEGALIEAAQVHEAFYDPGNLRQREGQA